MHAWVLAITEKVRGVAGTAIAEHTHTHMRVCVCVCSAITTKRSKIKGFMIIRAGLLPEPNAFLPNSGPGLAVPMLNRSLCRAAAISLDLYMEIT